jgi:hypothetical protein
MGGQGRALHCFKSLESIFVGGSGSRFAIVSGMFPFSSLSPCRVNHAIRLGHILYRFRVHWVLHSLFSFPFSRQWHRCPYWPTSTWVSCGNRLGTRCRHVRGQNWGKGYSCSFGRPGSRVHMARQATTILAMPMFYIRNSIICILRPC